MNQTFADSRIPENFVLLELLAFRLWVWFSDGSEGVADLSRLMARSESMVAPLKDPAFFSRVFVEAGVPTWPNGYDYAPSALYAEMREAGRSAPRNHDR